MSNEIPFVYVVGGDPLVCKMFLNRGWRVADEQTDMTRQKDMKLDLVCFTGGEDVSPEIYGETNQGSRGCNLSRDQEEVEVFNHYKSLGIPMVGICRGGQLLNVLNGGRMIQDLGRTVSGVVTAYPEFDNAVTYQLLVDHHQGMVPTCDIHMMPTCDIRPAVWFGPVEDGTSGETLIMYAGYYEKTRSFCFQPHPEWGHKPTEDRFFELLEECL